MKVFSAYRSCSYLHVKEESFICFGCYFLNLRCTLREISCGFFIIKISCVYSWCMMTFRYLKLWQFNRINIVIHLHIKIQYFTHWSNACALQNIFNLIQSKLTYKIIRWASVSENLPFWQLNFKTLLMNDMYSFTWIKKNDIYSGVLEPHMHLTFSLYFLHFNLQHLHFKM